MCDRMLSQIPRHRKPFAANLADVVFFRGVVPLHVVLERTFGATYKLSTDGALVARDAVFPVSPAHVKQLVVATVKGQLAPDGRAFVRL